MSSLVNFAERVEEDEDRHGQEEVLELLGHHRIIKDCSNPLEALTEKETRYY
jgi:hypothetical protein